MTRLRFFAIALLATLSAPLALADPMEVTPLTIVTGESSHTFSVEVADDSDEICFGLMER